MRTRLFVAIVGLAALLLIGRAFSQGLAPELGPAENPFTPVQQGPGVPSSREFSAAALLQSMRTQVKAQLEVLDLQQKQTEEMTREQAKQIMEDAQRQVEQLEMQKKLFEAQAHRQIEELKLQAGFQVRPAGMTPPSFGFPNFRGKQQLPPAVKESSPSESGAKPAGKGPPLLDRLEKAEKRLEELEKKLPN
jgi:hypothetical protein